MSKITNKLLAPHALIEDRWPMMNIQPIHLTLEEQRKKDENTERRKDIGQDSNELSWAELIRSKSGELEGSVIKIFWSIELNDQYIGDLYINWMIEQRCYIRLRWSCLSFSKQVDDRQGLTKFSLEDQWGFRDSAQVDGWCWFPTKQKKRRWILKYKGYFIHGADKLIEARS